MLIQPSLLESHHRNVAKSSCYQSFLNIIWASEKRPKRAFPQNIKEGKNSPKMFSFHLLGVFVFLAPKILFEVLRFFGTTMKSCFTIKNFLAALTFALRQVCSNGITSKMEWSSQHSIVVSKQTQLPWVQFLAFQMFIYCWGYPWALLNRGKVGSKDLTL